MDLKQLFAQKGELVTQIEIAQQQLQQINLEISKILNSRQPEPEEKKE
jgi:hypothetical protein